MVYENCVLPCIECIYQIVHIVYTLYWREFLYLCAGLIVLRFICKLRAWFKPLKVYKANHGIVFVTRSALKSMIASACTSLNIKGRSFITQKGQKFYVKVIAQLKAGQPLESTTKLLQEHLYAVLTPTLGSDKIAAIDITINNFKALAQTTDAEPSKVELPKNTLTF